MRYISKANPSNDWDKYIEESKPRIWKAVFSSKRRELFSFLRNQQKCLCIYCEQLLPEYPAIKDGGLQKHLAHIEHIKPKSSFPELQFNQNNLSASCNGFDIQEYSDERSFCGHRKADEFNDDLFLHPFEMEEISQYFEYDINGNIYPNRKQTQENQKKASYMIDLLKLQHPKLINMRKNQYSIFVEEPESIEFINSEYFVLPAFYSMLVYLFN